MDYGSVIRTARKKAGMTQKELAEAMGVSEAFVCQYEKGNRIPKPSTLAKFAEATGTIFAPAMLFEESEEAGETVGERIRRYRKAAKLTQAELGRAINAAAITIRQYEIGAREPKLAQLQAVAAALGVPLTALVDDNIRTGGNYSGVDTPPVPAAAGGPHQSAALTASPRGSQGTENKRKEVIQMNELDRFRMAA